MTDLAACEFEPGSASRVMLGRESAGMLVYDLEAQRPAAKVMPWFSSFRLFVRQNDKQLPHTHCDIGSYMRACRSDLDTDGRQGTGQQEYD